MNYLVFALLLALGATPNALADLKPDALECDAKKAARNAAMGATVGVSGRCDTGKAAKNAKDNVVDDAKGSVDIDLDEKSRNTNVNGDKRGLKKKND